MCVGDSIRPHQETEKMDNRKGEKMRSGTLFYVDGKPFITLRNDIAAGFITTKCGLKFNYERINKN